MFETVVGELRAKLVGAGKQIQNRGFPAAQTPHHTQLHRPVTQTPNARTQLHRRRRHCQHVAHPTVPSRVAPDADTPRGRPGGRPLGVSHQHSASSPSKLLKMSLVGVTRARVARAVFPCDDTYCRRPTLRQRQGQLRKSWDFDPTDNWKQNECAPPASRGRTPCHAHSACCGISRSTGHFRRSCTTSSQSSDHPCTSLPNQCSGNTRNPHPSANLSPSHHWTPGSTR